jgi:hypothetical protein
MADGWCSLIPSVSKRNRGIALANHSGRGRVGVGRHLGPKWRRQPEASRHDGLKLVGGSCFACLCSRKEKGDLLVLSRVGRSWSGARLRNR